MTDQPKALAAGIAMIRRRSEREQELFEMSLKVLREGFRMRMIRNSQREEISIALSEAGEPGLNIIGPAPEPQGLKAVPQLMMSPGIKVRN